MKPILIVEDEANIRGLIALSLRRSGYETVQAKDGAEAADLLEKQMFDLVLLDVMLPGEDGVTILGKMKADERYSRIPVIMATARGTEFDKVQSLDLGADDYITKPFGMMEMISRVKAVLRRTKPSVSGKQLTLGELTVNLDRHTVTLAGERIQLTYKEYELLKLFLSHPGTAFSREQLLHIVWNTDYAMETRTVDMHIRTLRQKLGAYGQHIETVRGVGYRLEAQK